MNNVEYNIHEQYMLRAIHLAEKGRGKVSPNPMVGCVIVKNGKIVGEGYHESFGGDHAEINALKNCVDDPSDSSIYISLEPCIHEGKTPPCCNAIIENGIRDVYVSMVDPNPIVNGKSIDYLRNRGINVQTDILKKQSEELNRGYINWIKTNFPLVIGKLAQDNRGFIAKQGYQIWITGEDSKQNTHKLRSQVDAIIIGKNTALIDNPELTVRQVIGFNPKRVVLDTNRTLPYDLQLLNDHKSESIIVCSNEKFHDGRTSHCRYLTVNEINGKLDPIHVLKRLGEIGITSILIEGGAKLMQSFLSNNLIDFFYLYTAIYSNDKLDIKNPFTINDEWAIKDEKFLGDDQLTILEKKEKCLLEL
tara:strand:- start:350 stop:1435 length:1086 start_codon:yes stop_codon:yes gene_type:complete